MLWLCCVSEAFLGVFGGDYRSRVTPADFITYRSTLSGHRWMRGMTGAVEGYIVLDNFYSAQVSCASGSLACLGGAHWRRYQDASLQSASKTATPSFLLLAIHPLQPRPLTSPAFTTCDSLYTRRLPSLSLYSQTLELTT